MKTLHIPTSKAVPGMVSAADVYSDNGQLIIVKGTKLSDRIITRLKYYLIQSIIVVEDEPEAAIPVFAEIDSSYSDKIRSSVEFKKFKTSFLETSEEFKCDLVDIVDSEKPLNTSRLLEYTTKVLSESRNGFHVFDMLHCMRDYDDLTFVHSLNVSLICNVFGKWLKLSQADLDALTLSGLLHDIGKTQLPDSIISKQGALTEAEYAIVKTHTVKGYQILKNRNIDTRIKYSALMHHERCDGTGYPNQFHNHNIDSYAKIVSIIDVYDAMTSARVYRGALSPFEAISNFETEGLQKYDPLYILTFLEGIVQSYLGNRVRLNNDSEGTIVMINKHALSKPVVQTKNGFLDLSQQPNLFIQALV